MEALFGLFTMLCIGVLVLGALALLSYNRLQRAAQEVKEKTSNVQVAVSRKLSLLNQLVDIVRSFQEGEQFTHLKIAQESHPAGLMSAYQESGALMATLQGVAERFPTLKASEQYHRLIDSIQSSEEDIQHQREVYNAAVKGYNNLCLAIPTVFVARAIGFPSAPYLEFDHRGVQDPTQQKAFRTDDGERLQQLLSHAGQSIAGATRAIAGQAAQAGRLVFDATRETGSSGPDYFFMRPGGVPQGPASAMALRAMLADGRLAGDALAAPSGSDDWQPVAALFAHTANQGEA